MRIMEALGLRLQDGLIAALEMVIRWRKGGVNVSCVSIGEPSKRRIAGCSLG